jgi:hypothetical protein
MDSLSEGSLMAEDYTGAQEKLETRDRRMSFVQHSAISTDRRDVDQVTIDVLSDNVFLDIFDLYIQDARYHDPFEGTEAWNTLVHVCRRWRSVVFESPLRLDLQLLCTDNTPVREMRDIWPPLPIMIQAEGSIPDVDNIVALLKHNDRICEICLYKVPNLLLEKICAALIQESFPVLTQLVLASRPEMGFVVPPGPLSGGSAPLLRRFALYDVQFPELPSFLSSSTNHLTSLTLSNIPHSGYISPEGMVTCISALISLEHLILEFQSPHFLPDWESRRPPPPTRSVQPALRIFLFKGVSEYLEDFVARIDVPQLVRLSIAFFDEIIFDTSQLVQFIYRKAGLKALDEARVWFCDDTVRIAFSSQARGPGDLSVEISRGGSDWEFSTMVQLCTSFSRLLSSVESLYIYKRRPHYQDRDDIEDADQEWLDFLRPFTAVKDIYLCKTSAQQISFALEVEELVEERLVEALSTLQNIFLEKISPSRQMGIVLFVDLRKLWGHSIAISCWPDELVL